MSDSDEEEMRAMRASSRHATVGRSAAVKGPGAAAGSAGKQASHSSSGGGSRSLQKPASDDEDEEMIVAEDDGLEARSMLQLPMSFGKVAVDNSISMEVHTSTARKDAKAADAAAKGTVQFGSRVAVGRRGKGLSAQQQAEPGRPEGASMEADDGPPPQQQGAAESEDDEQPAQGREGSMLPVTHEVELPAHEKAVTALGLDPKGSRMAVGCLDGSVKLFDFAGMNEEKRHFREMEPAPGYAVQSVAFNKTGGMILVVSSDSHARIYDRDEASKPIQYTVKGDMYVRDMTHTKGHTEGNVPEDEWK